MKKGDICEGIVKDYEFPNKGIIFYDDVKVTVKNVLPGQKVSYMVQKKRHNKALGKLMDILEKSPLQTDEPFCPNFGLCGSCIYQTLSYETQISLKEKQVLSLIDGVCEGYVYDGIKRNPNITGYRNKMEYTFGDEYKDGPLTLGLHKRGSFYDIVDASCCKLVNDDFGKVLSTVKNYCLENNLSYYHRISHEGYLRHLLVRRAASTGELILDIVTTSQAEHDFDGLVSRLLSIGLEGKIVGILHTFNDSVADTIKNERTDILFGKDYFFEHIMGLKFKITPFSFFQTNSFGAEELYGVVRDYIKSSADGRIVYDLYSGTGTIAQMLSPVAKRVIGVEIVDEAVAAASENAMLNELSNCEFIVGDVLKTLDGIEEKPEVIVLDPPREGIHPKALAKILDYGVENIVYISCKPTSLVRDLEVIQERGYKVERVCLVDMFSWTGHVETVCLLSKLNVEHHIEVELTMDELDLTAAESKATYEEIKNYVLEHTGLKVSNLYIAQIKQKCGIIERANYNLPKSENSRQPKCPPEKEVAIREALEYFRMI